MTEKKRILIPYVDAGSGHKSFAASIKWFLEHKHPSWEVRLFDPIKEFDIPKIERMLVTNWKRLLAVPSFVTNFFFALEKIFPRTIARLARKKLARASDQAAEFLIEFEPDFIICTHWGVVTIMDVARGRLRKDIPIRYVFTELGGAYSPVKCGADIYYALGEEAADDLMRLGIPKESIRKVSFVTVPHLKLRAEPKIEARKRLGMSPDEITVLLCLGGEGLGPVMRFIERFIAHTERSRLIVLAGKNQVLLERIEARFTRDRVIPFGFLESVETVMSAADIFAGKAGTSFTSEAAVLKKPLAVLYLGAPNEKHNMKYVVNRGFAWYTPTPRKFAQLIARIENNNEILDDMVCNLENAVSDRNGAEEIADDIISALVDSHKLHNGVG